MGLEQHEQIAAGQLAAQAASPPAGDSPARAADSALAELADLLIGLLDAKVKITAAAGDRRRITIDVPEVDLARILSQLGLAA